MKVLVLGVKIALPPHPGQIDKFTEIIPYTASSMQSSASTSEMVN